MLSAANALVEAFVSRDRLRRRFDDDAIVKILAASVCLLRSRYTLGSIRTTGPPLRLVVGVGDADVLVCSRRSPVSSVAGVDVPASRELKDPKLTRRRRSREVVDEFATCGGGSV